MNGGAAGSGGRGGAGMRRVATAAPLVPLAVAVAGAIAIADAVVPGPLGLWLGGVAMALALWLLVVPGRRRAGLLVLVVLGYAGMHGWRLGTQAKVREQAGAVVQASGVVVAASEPGLGGQRCLFTLSELDGKRLALGCRVRLEGLAQPVQAGERLRVTGVVARLLAPRNPGEFDQANWLHRQGVAARLQVLGVPEFGGRTLAGRLAGWFAWLRGRLGEATTRGLDPASREAMVIRAMALGESPNEDPELVEVFRLSGTLHVFAVSGLHVGMVGSMVWLGLRMFGVSRRPAIVVLMGAMSFYAAITGMSPPALRAVIMASIFLCGFLLRRRPQLLNSLAAALLLVLSVDGHQLFTAGFQLSYGVLAAIALWSAAGTRLFAFLARPEPFLPVQLMTRGQLAWLRGRRSLASVLGMSTAAWAGSAPLSAVHFSMVAPLAVLAGLPVMALVWVVLALGLSAGLVACVWADGAVPLNRCNALVARLATQAAAVFAHAPGGYVRWGCGPPADAVIFDLPRGAAACHFGFGGGVLLDAGSARDFEWSLGPALGRLNGSVDSLVASHPDGAHLGGLVPAFQQFQPRQVLLPVVEARSPAFRQLQQLSGARALVPPAAGCRYPLGDGAVLEVVYRAADGERQRPADDRVMVLRLHHHGWRILYASDAGPAIEAAMLASGADLRADVLVTGHHFSGIPSSDAFLAAVAPRVVVASYANFPACERIDPDWAAWLRRTGIRLMRQDQTGAVLLRWTPDGLELRGFLDGTRVLLAQPGRR